MTKKSRGNGRQKNPVTIDDLAFLDYPLRDPRVMDSVCIVGGSGTVASDWHLPLTSKFHVMHLIEQARKNKATDWLAIPGDWWNFDAISDYYPKQSDHTLMGEIQSGRKLMKLLFSVFDRIVVALGNHDERYMKKLGFSILFEQSMELCFGDMPEGLRSRLEFTGLDSIIIATEDGPVLTCHTRQYSKNQLVVPAQIADIERCHVIAGHRHHHAVGFSPSGYRVGESGGLFDSERTYYIRRYKSSHPKFQPGYFIIRQNGEWLAPMLTA